MPIRSQFVMFLVRWLLNSVGLWVATRLLGGIGAEITGANIIVTFVVAGFVLSLINVLLRPMLVILALPFVLVTLGLFMLVINGIVVYITIKIAPGIMMTFGASILAGIIISLVNYLLTGLLQLKAQEKK